MRIILQFMGMAGQARHDRDVEIVIASLTRNLFLTAAPMSNTLNSDC
ncbi:hypothetical protein R80B4_03027 [Fibrobacteres bacterium R8-0-B4]